MTEQEAVNALDNVDIDPESGHIAADKILLAVVPPAVAEAYERLKENCRGFWYA